MKLRCFGQRFLFVFLVLSLAAGAVCLHAELDDPPGDSERLGVAAGPQPIEGTEGSAPGADASGRAAIGGSQGSAEGEAAFVEEFRHGLLLSVSWIFLVVGLLLVALTLRKTYRWLGAVQKARHPPTRYFNLQLKVRGADGALAIHNFDYYPVIVASGGTADLLLPSASGERSRFRIDYSQGEARLMSDASLIVNGVPRIQKRLRQGDRIVFGSYRLDFKDASVREQAAPLPGKPVFAWQFPVVALLLAFSVLFKQAGPVPRDTVLAKAVELRAIETSQPAEVVEVARSEAIETSEQIQTVEPMRTPEPPPEEDSAVVEKAVSSEAPFIRGLLSAVARSRQRQPGTAGSEPSKEDGQTAALQLEEESIVPTSRQDPEGPKRIALSRRLSRRRTPETRQPVKKTEVPDAQPLTIPSPVSAAAAAESRRNPTGEPAPDQSELDRITGGSAVEEREQFSGEEAAGGVRAFRTAVEQTPSLKASVLGTLAAIEEQTGLPDRGQHQKTASVQTLSTPETKKSDIESTGQERATAATAATAVVAVTVAAKLPAETRQAEDSQEAKSRSEVAVLGQEAKTRSEEAKARSRSLPQPRRIKVRVIGPGRRIEFFKADILFIHAHPDDESIDFGTMMARASRSGKRIATLLFTDGESGLDLYPQRKIGDIYPARPLQGRALSQVRVVEATRALSVLGSEMYIRWGLRNCPYNSLRDVLSTEEVIEGWGGEEKLLARLEEVLAGFEPTVIVSPDEHSKAWEHFEHEAVGCLVKKAIARVRANGNSFLKGYLVSVDPYQKDSYSDLIGIEALDHDPESDVAYRSIQALALKEHVTQRDAAVIGVSKLSNLPLEYYKVMYWELSDSVQGYLK